MRAPVICEVGRETGSHAPGKVSRKTGVVHKAAVTGGQVSGFVGATVAGFTRAVAALLHVSAVNLLIPITHVAIARCFQRQCLEKVEAHSSAKFGHGTECGEVATVSVAAGEAVAEATFADQRKVTQFSFEAIVPVERRSPGAHAGTPIARGCCKSQTGRIAKLIHVRLSLQSQKGVTQRIGVSRVDGGCPTAA